MARDVAASLSVCASLAGAAINLDGSPAVAPLGDGDPSPIHNPRAYEPDLHNGPLSFVDYAYIHNGTPYLSVDRFRRCEEPLLLQFPVTQPLDDPASTILIRCCTPSTTTSQPERPVEWQERLAAEPIPTVLGGQGLDYYCFVRVVARVAPVVDHGIPENGAVPPVVVLTRCCFFLQEAEGVTALVALIIRHDVKGYIFGGGLDGGWGEKPKKSAACSVGCIEEKQY